MDDNSRGGCCGVIFLLLLLYGGYQLFQHFQSPSGCEGWETWARTSEARANSLISRTQSLSPYTGTNQEKMDIVNDLRAGAAAERTSHPPDKARTYSDSTATFYTMLATAIEAQTLNEPAPYTESVLRAQADQVTNDLNAANKSCGGG